MRVAIIIFMIGMCLGNFSFDTMAQLTDKQKASEIFRHVDQQYRSKPNLHFSILYRYAAEDKPSVYLDSLSGECTLNGDQYLYRLDSTEFIGDKHLTMVVYREDKTIYLTKPSGAKVAGNPVAQIDSLLLKNDSIRCQVTENAEEQTIRLVFPAGGVVREMRYVIDRATGYIIRMVNIVPASELYDPSVRSRVEGPATYAVVETLYEHYRQESLAAGALDPARYFKKEGTAFIALAPYETYTIIPANSGL